MVLRQPRLADLFFCEGILFERGGERVLTSFGGAVLLNELRTRKGCTGYSVVEGLGLRFGRRVRSECSLCLGGVGSTREERDLL